MLPKQKNIHNALVLNDEIYRLFTSTCSSDAISYYENNNNRKKHIITDFIIRLKNKSLNSKHRNI